MIVEWTTSQFLGSEFTREHLQWLSEVPSVVRDAATPLFRGEESDTLALHIVFTKEDYLNAIEFCLTPIKLQKNNFAIGLSEQPSTNEQLCLSDIDFSCSRVVMRHRTCRDKDGLEIWNDSVEIGNMNGISPECVPTEELGSLSLSETGAAASAQSFADDRALVNHLHDLLEKYEEQNPQKYHQIPLVSHQLGLQAGRVQVDIPESLRARGEEFLKKIMSKLASIRTVEFVICAQRKQYSHVVLERDGIDEQTAVSFDVSRSLVAALPLASTRITEPQKCCFTCESCHSDATALRKHAKCIIEPALAQATAQSQQYLAPGTTLLLQTQDLLLRIVQHQMNNSTLS